MEKIKSYFKRYPKSDEVFENGGRLFHDKGAADSFGKTETTKYTRNQPPKSPEGGLEEIQEDLTEENSDVEKTDKENATIFLKGTEDVAALDYNVMKKLAKDLELSTADTKKETLVVALSEYKENLKGE